MKKLIVILLMVFLLVGCTVSPERERERRDLGDTLVREKMIESYSVDDANNQLYKAMESGLTTRSSSYAGEASAIYLKFMYEEELKQTELLQKILDALGGN